MTIHLFEKTQDKPIEEQADFLQRTMLALSYLETAAFKESFYLLRTAISLAQLAAEKEMAQSHKHKDVKKILKLSIDEL